MIRPLHLLARWRRRTVHALRCPVLVGYDPAPSLGGGEYYLHVGRRGWRYGYEFKLSRDDMEQLGEAITELLVETRANDRGGWQWFDRPEHEDGLANWERNLLEQQTRTEAAEDR